MAAHGRTDNYRPFRCDDDGVIVQIDYLHAIARGMISGAGLFRQIGRNADVDDVREDAWESGGTYVFPAAGGIQMRVISSSANDDGSPAGTGARTVDLHYLTATGAEAIETITMNGTTQVLTTPTNIWRVQDFHVRTAGSLGLADGTISLTNTAGTVTYSTIQPTNGRQRQAIWTVPLGKKAFIIETLVSGNATGGGVADYIEGYLRATADFDGDLLADIFQFKNGVIQSNSGVWTTHIVPIVVPALADIKMSVQSRSSSSSVTAVAGFAGWYEDETP